jgi:hypothetical protein
VLSHAASATCTSITAVKFHVLTASTQFPIYQFQYYLWVIVISNSSSSIGLTVVVVVISDSRCWRMIGLLLSAIKAIYISKLIERVYFRCRKIESQFWEDPVCSSKCSTDNADFKWTSILEAVCRNSDGELHMWVIWNADDKITKRKTANQYYKRAIQFWRYSQFTI